MRNSGWLIGAVAGALLAGGVARAADIKVAVVDMQRALNECDAGKKAKDQVKGRFEKAQNDLKRQREDLDRRREDYDKKALVLKEEERRNLERELENRGLDFKRKYEDLQRDLKRTDAELTSGIVEDLYAVVQEYGPEHGYTLVLEASSGALLYADKATDVTEDIIRLYNSQGPRPRKKKAASDDE